MPPRSSDVPDADPDGWIYEFLHPYKPGHLLRIAFVPTDRHARYGRDLRESTVEWLVLALIRKLMEDGIPPAEQRYSERVRRLARRHFLEIHDEALAGGGWEA